jgi:serine protease Do
MILGWAVSLALAIGGLAQTPDVKLAMGESASAAAATAKKIYNERFNKANFRVIAAISDAVARPSYSAVRVRCDNKDVALGTVVEADGYILTKASELKNSKLAVRFKDGRELPAQLVAVHPRQDLALLKVKATGLSPAEWRDSKDDGVGSWVASVGPSDEAVAVGNISVAARVGPRGPNLNSGFLGVQMDELEGGKGVKLKLVMTDTAAEKAGLKNGDVITTINSSAISGIQSMQDILMETKPGDKITIKGTREGKPIDITVTLGKRPQTPGGDRGDMQNRMGSVLSDKRTGFPKILQHDTVLKNTDCGGPLVDLDGKVVGINIARAGRTETWAIPAEDIQPIIVELKSGKFPPPRIKELESEIKRLHDEKVAVEKKAQDDKGALEKKIKDAEDELKQLKENK